MLGFVVAILDNTEAEVIVDPSFFLSSSTVMELVRMTVLVVAGSTGAALGIEGMGLVLLRRERHRPRDGGSGEECKNPGFHAIAIVSLETVGAIKRDADSDCNRAAADLNLSVCIDNGVRA